MSRFRRNSSLLVDLMRGLVMGLLAIGAVYLATALDRSDDNPFQTEEAR